MSNGASLTGARADAAARADYADSNFLLFGCTPDAADDTSANAAANAFDFEGTAAYLRRVGFAECSLTQARKRRNQAFEYAGYHDPDARYCDFCGKMLAGAEYDALKDGRERCLECSETVVNGLKAFEELFYQVKGNMCAKYGIDFPSEISVKVISQAKMARMQGKKFVPTKYFDPRCVGLAVNKRGKYSMYFENGTPKASLTATSAHELTHIWQYSHWNWAAMQAKYGRAFLAVCEGMAKWSELQYLYLMNETAYADRFLANEVARDDVYGYGLRLFLNKYPMSKGLLLSGPTPFTDSGCPIEIE